MTPRRIAYVVEDFPKLSETFIAGEMAELRRRGVEVKILARKERKEQAYRRFIEDPALERLAVYGAANFSAALRDFQPDLIHAHYATGPAGSARALAAEFGLPFTFTAHGFDIYFRAPSDFAARAAAAAAVITVSEANARHIATSFGVPRQRIHVIPCGVDTALFRPAEAPADAPAGRLDRPVAPPGQIVCVARHWPVKNLRLLLEACAILRDRGTKFRCVMIGDGPSHDELVGIRAQLKLEPLVEMTGAARQATVLEWLRHASVAALSSNSEGMPVSLMEAGACGVPVVAPRVGGVPELVEDGVTGLLTPPGDAPAMADAFERLLTNPRLRAAMGRAARRRIEANFSLGRQVDRLLNLWSSLAANGRPASRDS